jgi:hypothetical protein
MLFARTPAYGPAFDFGEWFGESFGDEGMLELVHPGWPRPVAPGKGTGQQRHKEARNGKVGKHLGPLQHGTQ